MDRLGRRLGPWCLQPLRTQSQRMAVVGAWARGSGSSKARLPQEEADADELLKIGLGSFAPSSRPQARPFRSVVRGSRLPG
jgi:hypothetical protein